MTVDMSGAYKRVNESHYPGRIRETGLTRERADDQRHLAELEEFVKKHKGKHSGKDGQEHEEEEKTKDEQQDVVELHTDENQIPPKSSPQAKSDQAKKPSDDDRPHLDIRI